MRGAMAVAGALLTSGAWAQDSCPVRDSWPVPAWPSNVAAVGQTRADQIQALEDFAFTLTGPDRERVGTRTDGVVIIHDGAIVYERYARGWTPEKRHLSWSVSKSFTNALTGIAVMKGVLGLEDSVCQHLETGVSGPICDLKVQHLLEFGSGLDWMETYEGQSNQASSVLAMLYGQGRQHMARFVWSHAFRDPPGTSWAYSSGDTTLLMHVVGNALTRPPTDLGADFPWTELLNRIGAGDTAWERDAAGTFVGSSYVHATPRDLARLGFLYLNDGCWNGVRLLPPGWVGASVVPSSAFLTRRLYWEPGDVQGRQFWLNTPVPAAEIPTPWPDVPEDAYAMRGHWGQSVTIIPSLDLIVVRVADDRDGTFDFNRFLSLAIAVGRP